MTHLDREWPDTEERARTELSREFPHVPPRIVASVYEAYLRVMPDRQVALAAARRRLRDACAI
jgi:hypothetical protein